jgi:hypothetical protein
VELRCGEPEGVAGGDAAAGAAAVRAGCGDAGGDGAGWRRGFRRASGTLEGFGWPVTREEALLALEDFISQGLPRFGDYQDAMKAGEAFLYRLAAGAGAECRAAGGAGGVRGGGGGLAGRAGAAERGRGVHPADPWVAGVCARRLLDADAGLRGSRTRWRRGGRCRRSTGRARRGCGVCGRRSAARGIMPIRTISSG